MKEEIMDLAQQELNNKVAYHAYLLALKSNCKRRQYGAVLIKNNKIIATGYNMVGGSGCECSTCVRENYAHNEGSYANCPAIHAERQAIINAKSNHIKNLKGAKLILVGIENNKKLDNVEPCHECKKFLDKEGIIY